MNKDETLRLLIVDTSRNDAEQMVNTLRGAGFAVRAAFAEDEEDMLEAAGKQVIDMVLCATGLPDAPIAGVCAALVATGKDMPLIAVAPRCDAKLQVSVIQEGARDLALREPAEHLPLIVAREFDALLQRRAMQRYKTSYEESETRARALIDSSRDAITYVHDGMHIYANSVYLGMFGFAEFDEVEGTPIMDMVAPADHPKLKDFLRRYSKGESSETTLQVQGLRPDGAHFSALMEFFHASIGGEACTQIIIRDQSSSKELEKKIKHLSKQDLLTGLYNRQYFLEDLELTLARAPAERGDTAILYILLDNFKAIKDTVGIAGSDLVLSDIACLLRASIRSDDIAARFADNVFTVMTRGHSDFQALAETIRRVIEEHISEVAGQSITTTVSIGIHRVDGGNSSAHDVVARADLACEIARTGGGNRCHTHDPVQDAKADQAKGQQWTALIKHAVETDGFRLVYQPIVSMQGDPVERYEVLLRMVGPDNDLILPGQFIPVAEQSTLILDIDRWVIGNAVRLLAEHQRSSGKPAVFFIKLSGVSLSDPELLPWISERLKAARLQGDSLVFELHQQTATAHLKEAKQFVAGLKQLRCGFAIEHFGARDNAFHILKHLATDYLKIDGSLMHKLAQNTEQQETVRNIAAQAHEMGKLTIAEFVEDASSLSVLWQCGVKFIQGNFLQEPHPLMDYEFSEETTV